MPRLTASSVRALLDRQVTNGRRVAASVLIAAVTACVLPLLDLPLWFGLLVLVGQVVGYNVLAFLTAGPPAPETLRQTLVFLAIVLAASLPWAAVILLLGYALAY